MSRNLTSALVDDLRARIVDGRISPGERLPSESTLIAEHGVSRTVVREAVARLQAEGLVHTRRGSGSFVLTPPAAPGGTSRPVRTLQDRRRLLAFRPGVESEAAALAAAGMSGEWRATLRPVCRVASGVRSSWAAAARKLSWRRAPARRRASSWLRVSASSCTSSPVAGTGTA